MERLKSIWRALPPAVRIRIPARAETFLRARALPALRGETAARRLEAKLWGGFSRSALPALAALAADPAAAPCEAAGAALALARWHGAAGDWEAALAAMIAARDRHPPLARDRRQFLPEALFLARLGRPLAARALIEARAGRRFDPSAALLLATTWNPSLLPEAERAEATARALDLLNAVFRRAGPAPLRLRDPAAPLNLDNLAADAAPGSATGPLVTVILPFHDAARTLKTALESLAAQTHAALEVLMVDDASGDAGAELAAGFAARDPRFRLIRELENRGGYTARNRALAEARGAFVTVHDADDWSHPEKIARQVADLGRSRAPLNLTDWVRASDTLLFWGPWLPSPDQCRTNFSSAMVRREVFARAGPWDTARVGADREFVDRVARLWGRPAPVPLLAGVPLAFGRDEEGSLTRAGPTHAATALHGIRREYREAAAHWHAGLDPAAVRAGGLAARPPFFPAPAAIRPSRAAPDPDLLFIGDFNLVGGTQQSALHMIRAARAAGRSAALLHYRRYDLDPTRPLAPATRRFAAEHDLRIVAPGERLAAKSVIVTYPPLLAHALDRFPEVAHDGVAVVVNQMAERTSSGGDPAYNPGRVRAHLVELLGTEGRWMPISARVRTLMATDPRYPPPDPDTWTPLIDEGAWTAPMPAWRGAARARPVLGRHGRDHPLKWPADPAALRDAYCAGRPCEVRFLGGAHYAKVRAGRWPRNWREEPFGARDVREFLARLDVFLHYPDPDYIEEFGRAPMEAMAAGVPVILPPEFAPTFGAAALYAAPGDVWPTVEAIWRNRAAWEARAQAGRAFVRAHCSYAVFATRLARLEAAPAT